MVGLHVSLLRHSMNVIKYRSFLRETSVSKENLCELINWLQVVQGLPQQERQLELQQREPCEFQQQWSNSSGSMVRELYGK